MKTEKQLNKKQLLLLKVCHHCQFVMESEQEPQKCAKCSKSFLPLQYFEKVHTMEGKYEELFSAADELNEKDLIKGLYVIW